MGQAPPGCCCSEAKDQDTLIFGNPNDPDAAVQAVVVAPAPIQDNERLPAAVALQEPTNSPDPFDCPAPSVVQAKDTGLIDRCQGTWYREDDLQRIGTVDGDHITWEETFEHPPSQLTPTSFVTLTMKLVGDTHSSKYEEGPPERLVW